MGEIKILLIDDCEVCRKGISRLLGEDTQFSIIGEFQFANDAFDLLKRTEVNVVIIDLNITDMDEREIVQKVKFMHPDSGILVFSNESNEEYLVSLAKAGVSSYLPKNTPLDQLVHTIKNIHNGESYFSKNIAAILSEHLVHFAPEAKINENEKNHLTPREMEVLKLISEGLTNKQVARELFISPRTVDTHRRNILLKIEVKNTAGLVNYYHEIKNKEDHLLEPIL